jgi:hypothetical protein
MNNPDYKNWMPKGMIWSFAAATIVALVLTLIVSIGWLKISFLILTVILAGMTVSTILGGFAFSCFWGILEMHQQEQRVVKGWFPENPKRHDYYEALRLKRPR